MLLFVPATDAYSALGDCGQPVSSGPSPTASDALFTLRAAVGGAPCDLAVCDVDSTCSISAGDALRILRRSVNGSVALSCECQPATTSSTLGTTTSTTLPGASWTEVFAIITTRSCGVAGCHGGGNPSGGLDLSDSATAYAELVHGPVECETSAFSVRVLPGDEDSSFLYAKVSGTHDCGDRMPNAAPPFSFPPLPANEIETIRSWIASGARNE